ncbi:RND family efflux transporter MFP subunit [Tenacibaculum adriaticum]|uniref:RND family efflux transporter MFP subunit n=1 Tax=Tenacibaculum adriaticum TaxID=413713 RepID=A0A5S5DVQ8_9FLAO|nr:efflux RND transporter periplasmic adaptor subunit [Tenacibaculum adriaticum]TYQ00071.1 RND family efflux transporter MFP subunit [Tenacibaculum adriaticum]
MKKYIYTIALVSLSLLVTSCGSDDKKVTTDNSTPIAVKVKAVQADGNNPFVTASGKIQAENSADLSTRMMGFVNKVYVNVGDKVSKGQLLMSINNADLQAKRAQVNAGITEATAAYNNAEKDYNRFKSLFAEKSASQKEMDDMTAHFEMAKARLEAANQMKNEVNAQFKYANITAPFNGVVTSKNIEAGDMANPGMPLISVEAPGKFEVMAMVPESEISQIKKGTEVSVVVKSINETLKGKVTEVSTSAKNTGGQFLVKVALDKTDAKILSGMFTTVQFPVAKKATASTMILIPTSAIVEKGQLTGVYTVSQSNTAVLRWLRLGRTFGDNVEVLSGLSAKESYIVSAEGKLYNGAKISIK